MSTAVELPHWDVTTVYPGLESPEFEQEFAAVVEAIVILGRRMTELGIGPHVGFPVDEMTVAAFDEMVRAFDALQTRLHTLGAYIRTFISTDSYNTLAQARASDLQTHLVQLAQMDTLLTAWIGSLDSDELTERSAVARDIAFALRKTREEAEHLMSLPEENLAAELEPTGGSAWGKLYSTITSQLLVPIEVDDGVQSLPMSVVRNLAHSADRAVRMRAYTAEMSAWAHAATPLAAALNSIKGETNIVQERRQWDSALDYALFLTNIDRVTLDAMMEAARDSFPDFRRYLHTKARALGLERLAFYDLFAPVGENTRPWEYEEARSFLLEQFGAYSPRLRDFAARAFAEQWIDAEPRPGKVGGAFCMWLRGDESRVLTNYIPSYDGVSTLAHELGHAYHNYNLAGRSMWQRQTPMTLAETASIFCETIIEHAALARADRAEQIAIVEASIGGACQVVVDISSRFLFEKAVFTERHRRELSIEELNELMLDAQRQTYGDGLDDNALHPYMWAAKGHYYSTGRPYYNFPYMFGLLFGLGLYAQYQADPESFRTGYDTLLSSTGLADAATLAAGFGIDIRTPDFWHASLDIVRGNIDRFVQLIDDEG